MNARAKVVALQLGVLLCTGSIIALLGLQRIVSPLGTVTANLVVFAVQVAPLAAVAIAVIRLTPRCAFWTAFASLIYLCHGILQVFTLDGRLFGVFEVVFSLALFVLGFALSFAMRALPAADATDDGEPPFRRET